MPELHAEALLKENVLLEESVDSLRARVNDTAEQRNRFRAHAETLAVELRRAHEELAATRQRAEEAEARYEELRRERSGDAEAQEEARRRWAAQLEQAERDFHEMQRQLIPPEDLEAMRFQLIEEAQAPWRARVKGLEAEVEQARQALGVQRRESETLRERLEGASLEHRAALREAEMRHEMVEADLRAKLEIRASSHSSPEPVDNERSRRLQRENAELSVRHEKLLQELEELRSENDNLLHVRNHLIVSQAQREGEERGAIKLAATERDSLQRRAQHLQHELDAAHAAHERLQETVLRGEAEARQLRAAVDDAAHALSSERVASTARVAEVQREIDKLRVEMERRHSDSLRRETTLQRARDEVAGAAARQEREAAALLARCREEEAMRAKRAEAERVRLNEELVKAQSAAAASAAALRDRVDAAQGECAALKAELHGASAAKSALTDEAHRMRRRAEEAEERLGTATQELYQLRLEHSELAMGRAERQDANGELVLQLAAAQKEAREAMARAEEQKRAIGEKVKHAKRQWASEKTTLHQSEASRAKQIESLKRAVLRLRGERDELRRNLLREPSERLEAAAGGGAGGGSSRQSAGGMALTRSSAGFEATPLDLEAMLSEERVMQAEARGIKAQLQSLTEVKK